MPQAHPRVDEVTAEARASAQRVIAGLVPAG